MTKSIFEFPKWDTIVFAFFFVLILLDQLRRQHQIGDALLTSVVASLVGVIAFRFVFNGSTIVKRIRTNLRRE